MFKKGVISDEISQDFKVSANLAKKHGLDGVEIRSVWEKGPHELSSSEIREIKSILDGMDLKVCAISSPFFKCPIDNPSEIKEHIEILKKSINLAQRLGTNIVRGFTFWNTGIFESVFDRIIELFDLPLKIIESEKITLALESEENVFASTALKTRKIIEGLNSQYVRGLWDPGNDIFTSDGEVPYPDGYDIIKPFMVHMHLKDVKKMPDGKTIAVPVGKGDVDWTGQFKALIRDDYEGYVVLETHYRPNQGLSENLLALPKGSAFSYLGFEATEECLINWGKLLTGI